MVIVKGIPEQMRLYAFTCGIIMPESDERGPDSNRNGREPQIAALTGGLEKDAATGKNQLSNAPARQVRDVWPDARSTAGVGRLRCILFSRQVTPMFDCCRGETR